MDSRFYAEALTDVIGSRPASVGASYRYNITLPNEVGKHINGMADYIGCSRSAVIYLLCEIALESLEDDAINYYASSGGDPSRLPLANPALGVECLEDVDVSRLQIDKNNGVKNEV